VKGTAPAYMGAPLSIELSWPAKELSPNARPHHFVLYKAKQAAKHEAEWAARVAIGAQWGPTAKFQHDGASDIILRQIAHPPDNRSRDRDNLDHSLKYHRDAIAKALGVNDRFFRPTGIEWGAPVRGGKVIVEINP
jgi:crossover junction endodeoxyribonuclease RusA